MREAEWLLSTVHKHQPALSFSQPLKSSQGEAPLEPDSGISASLTPEACGFGCSCSPSPTGSVAGKFLRRLPYLWSLATETAGHSFAKL